MTRVRRPGHTVLRRNPTFRPDATCAAQHVPVVDGYDRQRTIFNRASTSAFPTHFSLFFFFTISLGVFPLKITDIISFFATIRFAAPNEKSTIVIAPKPTFVFPLSDSARSFKAYGHSRP